MDFDKLIQENTAKSSRLFLQRQELELQAQNVRSSINLVEMQLLKLDGEMSLLVQLKEQEKSNG